MTDTFTLEKIVAAFKEYDPECSRAYVDGFIKVLTRPRVEFAEGEVVASQREGSASWEYMPASYSGAFTPRQAHYCRKLSTIESGAGALVVALERIIKFSPTTAQGEIARVALKVWRQERGE